MDRTSDHKLLTDIGRTGPFRQCELTAGGKSGDIPAAFEGFAVCAEFFHSNSRPLLAVRPLVESSGIVKDLEIGVGKFPRVGLRGLQIAIGIGEIVIGLLILSTVMPAFGYPVINMFFFVPARERTESKLLVFWKRLMCDGRVRKDGGMLVLLVLKVVVNAFLFQQSADEIEVRLPILYAIVPGCVITGRWEFEIAEAASPEYIA